MGSTGKDDDAGIEGGDRGERRSSRDAEGEDGERADAAGYEVGVLRAIVHNQHQIAAVAAAVAVTAGCWFDRLS